ncbi:hypothetical protein BDQ17DRAFT_1346300 [Cyathus striatus]|nr:hypothetical protein BDQ17DRAFT_1346300 [Cyathus striatus]
MISSQSSEKDFVPTIDTILLCIQSMQELKFVRTLCPDFLNLLTTLESYRLTALEKARDALVWDAFYSKQSAAIVLSDKEKDDLTKMKQRGSDTRRIYINIIIACCMNDLFCLWTAKHFSASEFIIRFKEYFPFFTKSRSPLLFHSELSSDEHKQLQDAANVCLTWVEQSYQQATSNGKNISVIPNEYSLEYPATIKLITFYLNDVQYTVSRLKTMFCQ